MNASVLFHVVRRRGTVIQTLRWELGGGICGDAWDEAWRADNAGDRYERDRAEQTADAWSIRGDGWAYSIEAAQK